MILNTTTKTSKAHNTITNCYYSIRLERERERERETTTTTIDVSFLFVEVIRFDSISIASTVIGQLDNIIYYNIL